MKKYVDESSTVSLSGFNNLTKSLSFNLYDFCVARNQNEMESYANYIQETYNAEKILGILREVCNIIEANVLAESKQDYEPWGASCLQLLSDLKTPDVSLHLDKSHICAHTYPDFRLEGSVCSFRIDIEISTCGEISPLKALNYLLEKLYSDVVIIDYKVRGFTRSAQNSRIFIDHPVDGLSQYIDPNILKEYYSQDLTIPSEKIWQKKMIRTHFEEQEYFRDPVSMEDPENQRLLSLVRDEMHAIFYMRP